MAIQTALTALESVTLDDLVNSDIQQLRKFESLCDYWAQLAGREANERQAKKLRGWRKDVEAKNHE